MPASEGRYLHTFLYVLIIIIAVSSGCGEKRPSIILIVLDATRADHLGCYGYQRNTSPAIDSLAVTGTIWLECQAQAPWTLPACATIHTGLDVHSHGVMQDLNGTFGIPQDLPTAAQLFSEKGYFTAAVTNSYWTGPEFGFDRGFDLLSHRDNGNSMAGESVDELIEMLSTVEADQEFFGLLHLYDPHTPYNPPNGFDSIYCDNPNLGGYLWSIDENTWTVRNPQDLQRLTDLYDGEISWVDSRLSMLFGWLRENGRAENTIVIITADHGEEFLDHGWVEHSVTLYQEVLHVPLIITGPGIPQGETVSTVVGQFDILPTMLDAAGFSQPGHLSGISLLPLTSLVERPVQSAGATINRRAPNGFRNRNWIAEREGDRKIIWMIEEDRTVGFNLYSDPLEQTPVAPDSMLMETAVGHISVEMQFTPFPIGEPTQERLDELRGLGYF